MFSLLSFVLMQAALGFGENASLSPQSPGHTTESEAVTSAQLEGIAAFYREGLRAGPVRSVQRMAKSWRSGRAPFGSLEGEVTIESNSAREPDDVIFDAASGEVYLFQKRNWHTGFQAEKFTRNDCISEDRAWRQIVPVLDHYGLTTSRDEYDIRLKDVSASDKDKGTLKNATWSVLKKLSYKGTPYRTAVILVHVSAFTAEVVSLFYYPAVVPCEAECIVSVTEALERVKVWLAERPEEVPKRVVTDETDGRHVQKVIAEPNNWFRRDEKKEPSEGPRKAYYCWEVPYRVIEGFNHPDSVQHEYSFSAWVRVDTGEIIGGWEPY